MRLHYDAAAASRQSFRHGVVNSARAALGVDSEAEPRSCLWHVGSATMEVAWQSVSRMIDVVGVDVVVITVGLFGFSALLKHNAGLALLWSWSCSQSSSCYEWQLQPCGQTVLSCLQEHEHDIIAASPLQCLSAA